MEKYVRVSEMNKDHPTVFTAEEIVDNTRGVDRWYMKDGKWFCGHCWCVSKDPKRFCGYCGAKLEEV